MSRIELIATATFGLEAVVSRELRLLGYEEQTVENSRPELASTSAAIASWLPLPR